MSKVICDVCGTTYPETASACPICGCAKNTTEQTAADIAEQSETGASYTYVKGGRFSKSNVRKRNKGTVKASSKAGREVQRAPEPKPEQDRASKGLIAVVLILMLAIVAVLVYIGLRFFGPQDQVDPSDNTTVSTDATDPSDSTEPSGPVTVPCTGIKLSNSTIELSAEGSAWLLSAEVLPENTTDKLVFTSADETVATVTDKGNIEAVGGGETVITVTCGSQTAQCKIVCTFGDPVKPTDPTEPSVDIPADFKLTLRKDDITISERYPDPVSLFRDTDSVKASDITWSVDDPKVASVDEKGVVSAVGKGNTTVHAKLGDQTASCKVNVSFQPEVPSEDTYKISHKDVTLEVGKTFRLTLSTAEGANVEAQWTASEEGYVEIDGKNIKAVKSTWELTGRSITVSATVDEVTYSCIVRIPEAEEEEPET